jgi:hypothetical protein
VAFNLASSFAVLASSSMINDSVEISHPHFPASEMIVKMINQHLQLTLFLLDLISQRCPFSMPLRVVSSGD